VDAARKYVADELAKADDSSVRAKALKALNGYMDLKGSLSTKEVAALILILGLEQQYPHRGAVIGGIIADQLGLMPLEAPASQPAPVGGDSP